MPNWTSNELIVTGKHDEVARFVDHIGQTMDFEKIIPHQQTCFVEICWGRRSAGNVRRKGSLIGTIGKANIGEPSGMPATVRRL